MNTWTVKKIEKVENKVVAMIQEMKGSLNDLKELKAGEQILVDSDRQFFVYILEDPNNFAHLRFPEDVWGDLNKLRGEKSPVYVQFESSEGYHAIELVNFWEELNLLIDNIRGNSNYGEKMVSAVEGVFLK